jgi:hypothetical protein
MAAQFGDPSFVYFGDHEKLVDIFKTMKFVEKTHSAAIQLADFLAFFHAARGEVRAWRGVT